MFASLQWVIGIGMMHFSLTTLQEPGQEVHITAWIAAYATASTAGLKRPRDKGCTQTLRISLVSAC
jgi:hypothetical protein